MPRIKEVPLDFENLADLDEGRIEKLLMHHWGIASRDCISRPGDKTARVVTMEFKITPNPDPDTGECETTHMSINCKSKVPTYKSKPYEMRPSNRGFSFNKDVPDNIDQQVLYGEEEEAERDE